MFLEAYPEKVKAPERPQGSVLRRLDFNYMNGHGTFYRFDEEHFPEHLLKAETGDHVSVVLYNLHTDQLDEVVFKLEERYYTGEKCIYLRGPIDDIKDYYVIKFEYYTERPMDTYILVYRSAPPDYSCFSRL